MKFELLHIVVFFGGVALFVSPTNAEDDDEKSENRNTVPCPEENDAVCISCNCDPATGYNTCKPLDECPALIMSEHDLKQKKERKPNPICPRGKTFTALCAVCECSGQGRDHCGLCTALPVRRQGQPEGINKRLPHVTENRFFNYEINGWKI